MVKRDLNLWGKKEKITETYDGQGTIKIVKDANGKITAQEIKKNGTIDNIYCFIYRFRMKNQFSLGESLVMNLPTKDIKIKLVKKMKLKAASKMYDTFFMQSDPKQYMVWFDAGENKIPIRIDGSTGLGKTSMVMREYKR